MAYLQRPVRFQYRRKDERTVGRGFQPWLIFTLTSAALLGAIGARLTYLQVMEGQANRQLAENNRIRIAPKPPVRGNIFDRRGRILATTRLSYSAFILPFALKQENWPEKLALLAKILDLPPEDIEKPIAEAGADASRLVRIAKDLSPKQLTALEEFHSQVPEVDVVLEPLRYYPYGEVASHVLGYTGELNADQLKKRRSQGYRLGDIVGKMGLEAYYEPQLRGEWGGQKIEVNGAGKVMRILGEEPAKAGQDITISLNVDLQKAAEAAISSRRGAVVAIDPRTGEVLAMASNPGFDPNIFSKRITPAIWQRVMSKGDPFINRAIRGFPPASTFKIVTASAGMETGKYPPSTIIHTSAYIAAAGVRFYDWNKAGFGSIGYTTALAMSSNTFFGQVGRGVGGPSLIDWSRRYGFGSPTGIELPEETSGLIADDTWKQKNFNQPWSVGDSINMSIGQGFTLATPLQVAVMFAVPANGGYRVKPHFIKDDNPSHWETSLGMHETTLATIRRGLRQVVNGGTGKAINAFGLPPVAGKSGTAEAPPRPSHSWFGAFVPYDKPELVVVAFAEHSGGGGGKVAAPIVGRVMAAYYATKKKSATATLPRFDQNDAMLGQ